MLICSSFVQFEFIVTWNVMADVCFKYYFCSVAYQTNAGPLSYISTSVFWKTLCNFVASLSWSLFIAHLATMNLEGAHIFLN